MYHRETVVAPDAATLQRLYERGFAGAYWNPEAAQKFVDGIDADGGQRYGEDACSIYGIQDAGVIDAELGLMDGNTDQMHGFGLVIVKARELFVGSFEQVALAHCRTPPLRSQSPHKCRLGCSP